MGSLAGAWGEDLCQSKQTHVTEGHGPVRKACVRPMHTPVRVSGIAPFSFSQDGGCLDDVVERIGRIDELPMAVICRKVGFGDVAASLAFCFPLLTTLSARAFTPVHCTWREL